MIITRDEAIHQGLKRYFDGSVCSKLHFSERYVSNRTCVECCNAANRKRKDVRTLNQREGRIVRTIREIMLMIINNPFERNITTFARKANVDVGVIRDALLYLNLHRGNYHE